MRIMVISAIEGSHNHFGNLSEESRPYAAHLCHNILIWQFSHDLDLSWSATSSPALFLKRPSQQVHVPLHWLQIVILTPNHHSHHHTPWQGQTMIAASTMSATLLQSLSAFFLPCPLYQPSSALDPQDILPAIPESECSLAINPNHWPQSYKLANPLAWMGCMWFTPCMTVPPSSS